MGKLFRISCCEALDENIKSIRSIAQPCRIKYIFHERHRAASYHNGVSAFGLADHLLVWKDELISHHRFKGMWVSLKKFNGIRYNLCWILNGNPHFLDQRKYDKCVLIQTGRPINCSHIWYINCKRIEKCIATPSLCVPNTHDKWHTYIGTITIKRTINSTERKLHIYMYYTSICNADIKMLRSQLYIVVLLILRP